VIIDHGLQRFASATRLSLQAGRYVIFESQCSAHIMMLPCRHHDAYRLSREHWSRLIPFARGPPVRAPACENWISATDLTRRHLRSR
jgi:hypothetical protein